MERKLDNPAGRLHAILADFRGEMNSEGLSVVWRRALKMEDAQLPELMAAIGKVYALPEQVAQQMEFVPGYHPRDVSRWWNPLAQAFTQMHVSNVWQQAGWPNADVLEDLESCSVKLSEAAPEPHLTDDQLQYIKEQVAHIRRDIQSDDTLTRDTKRFIALRLQRIDDALAHIKISGTGQLRVELEATAVRRSAKGKGRAGQKDVAGNWLDHRAHPATHANLEPRVHQPAATERARKSAADVSN